MESISAELIAILGVGLTLGLVLLRQGARLDRRIDRLEEQTKQRFDKLEEQTKQRFDKLEERTDLRFNRLEERTDQRFDKLEEHVTALDADLRGQMGEVRERMAKLEGLLEGLREAITGKRAA